jgi:hypothetical protein
MPNGLRQVQERQHRRHRRARLGRFARRRLERLDNWKVPGPGEPTVEPGENDAAILDEHTEQPDYSEYSASKLKELLAARGIEVTEGSGSNGKPVKADLVAALEADDRK